MQIQISQELEARYKELFKSFREKICTKVSNSDAQLYFDFLKGVQAKPFAPISFDPTMVEVLKRYLESVKEEKLLEDSIKASKRFLQILVNNHFIKERHRLDCLNFIGNLQRNDKIKLKRAANSLKACINGDEFQDTWDEYFAGQSQQSFWSQKLTEENQQTNIHLSSILKSCQKCNMLRQLNGNLLQKLEDKFSSSMGITQKELQINLALRQYVESRSLENNSNIRNAVATEFDEICKILQEFASMNYFSGIEMKVGQFGSLVNGFATDDADLDISIMTNCYVKEDDIISALAIFLTNRLDLSRYTRPNPVTSTRVPVVSFERMRSVSSMKISIDIIVNNICGLINSKYLKMYSEMNRSVKQLGILIKLWAKKFGIIHKNLLSSYSFILMMINYLVKKGTIPNILRKVEGTDYAETKMVVKRFGTEMQSFPLKNYFSMDKKEFDRYKSGFSLLEYFKGFLQYYVTGGQFWQQDEPVISMSGHIQPDPNYIFTIKDPFDEMHNPGRARIQDKQKIMDTFEDAIRTVETQNKDKIMDLFK